LALRVNQVPGNPALGDYPSQMKNDGEEPWNIVVASGLR
jgi:hypothetical protein